MKRLSKADILGAIDLKTETVDVPEWGGSVTIRQWSVGEADNFGLLAREGQENGFIQNFRPRVVALSIIDEDGNLMFTPEDILELSKKSTDAMNRVHLAALKLNKMVSGEEAEDTPEKN